MLSYLFYSSLVKHGSRGFKSQGKSDPETSEIGRRYEDNYKCRRCQIYTWSLCLINKLCFLFLAEKIVTELEAQRTKLEKVKRKYCIEFTFN